MKLLVLGIFLGFSLAGNSFAQTEFSETLVDNVAENALPKVKGIVRRVDIPNATITIKHEEIPNLGMPAMTMTFAVQTPSMLNGLAPRDRILFSADEINGVLTAVWIEKQP